MVTEGMRVVYEHGLNNSDNISIAGFDGMPIVNQVWFQLTTVLQPLETMAKLATEKLITLICNEKTVSAEFNDKIKTDSSSNYKG